LVELAREWFTSARRSRYRRTPSRTSAPTRARSPRGASRLYGHRHANTRFQVTRVRGAQRDIIYDADVWEEPLLLEYASNVVNPAPNIPTQEGGWNGILDLVSGDRIEWYCDVNNTQNSTLTFTNQTYLGEMCIVDAEAVGSTCVGL
jgi:hypothetical protein